MRPLCITGAGVVSVAGIQQAPFRARVHGLARSTDSPFFGASETIDAQKVPGANVAEVRGFDAKLYLGDKGLRNFDRLTKLLIVAGKHALEDAGWKRDGAFVHGGPHDVGVISGTAYGSLEAITELALVAELEDPRYLNPARFPNTVINAAAGYVSIWEDLRAPNVTIVDGNASALDAFLSAETHLSHRRANAFLVGGGEAISDALFLAFRMLGILAEGDTRWRPAHPESGGIRLGEGAAFACVERLEDAQARGAMIRAHVAGYGTAFEPPTSEALIVSPSKEAVARAVRMALDDAGVRPSEVSAVVSSVSGLAWLDDAELAGLDLALGRDVPVAAPKCWFGETFGASGALGVSCALAYLDGAAVGPIVRGHVRSKIETVVVTAVGYYGNVSAVVLRRR